MPFSREEIAELMIGQVYDHCVAVENRILPAVEPEFEDDEGFDQRLNLDRWQDLRSPFNKYGQDRQPWWLLNIPA